MATHELGSSLEIEADSCRHSSHTLPKEDRGGGHDRAMLQTQPGILRPCQILGWSLLIHTGGGWAEWLCKPRLESATSICQYLPQQPEN